MTTAADRGWGPGWPNCQTHNWVTITIKDGTKFVVHKKVATIFTMFLNECIDKGYRFKGDILDDWGAACRAIGGVIGAAPKPGQIPSNHSWGLAIDVNALVNPQSNVLVTNIPDWMILLAVTKYGLYWGGFYKAPTKKDPMHFEFLGTPADADRITAALLEAKPIPVSPGPAEVVEFQGRKKMATDIKTCFEALTGRSIDPKSFHNWYQMAVKFMQGGMTPEEAVAAVEVRIADTDEVKAKLA